MIEVIGYESRADADHPLIWGGAAIRTPEGIFNAWGSGPISEEEWEEYVREGAATQIEKFIRLKPNYPRGIFTMSLRLDLLDKQPYAIYEDMPGLNGVLGFSRGKTRGYYAFENHDRLTSYLYHLHAGKYELHPAQILPR